MSSINAVRKVIRNVVRESMYPFGDPKSQRNRAETEQLMYEKARAAADHLRLALTSALADLDDLDYVIESISTEHVIDRSSEYRRVLEHIINASSDINDHVNKLRSLKVY